MGFLTTSRVPVFTASATIYVGNINVTQSPQDLNLQAGLNYITNTYAQMIPSPVIAQKAIDETKVHRFAGEVSKSTTAGVDPGTNLITVSVIDSSADNAINLANGISKAFVAQIKKYQPTTQGGQGVTPNEPAYVFQDATMATAASSGLIRKVLLFSLFGLVISIFVILVLDYLDITIKSPEELERRVGLPVLGIIPLFMTLPLSASPQQTNVGDR